ncbi:unnamed protein product [Lupinus luteus]|uniref:RNA helicase aquarius N-terminal domain-containing protein n=1 Tax=Lupinus luteus TaxID=3873 RepID=A0AAV1XB60_LUPLU
MINAFQSLEDEIFSLTVLRLASLKSCYNLSYGRFKMEFCLNPGLIKKWKMMVMKGASTTTEVMFLRNLIEEFLEILNPQVFPKIQLSGEDDALIDASGLGLANDVCILYCERFMEILIDLLSQLPTRSTGRMGGALSQPHRVARLLIGQTTLNTSFTLSVTALGIKKPSFKYVPGGGI